MQERGIWCSEPPPRHSGRRLQADRKGFVVTHGNPEAGGLGRVTDCMVFGLRQLKLSYFRLVERKRIPLSSNCTFDCPQ